LRSGAFKRLFYQSAVCLQNQRDGIIEVLTGFVESLALCIGAGQFLYEAT
jgi:hypothetical protein